MNYKIEEIDNKLNKLKKSEFGEDWVLKLIILIEKKIYNTKTEVDIKTFYSLIKELNLNHEQEKELNSLRNRIFHTKIDIKELKAKEKWLKNEIIPKVLNYPERDLTMISNYDDFNDKTYSKLIQLANEYNFKFQKEVKIKIGKRYYEIDALLQIENEIILIEITNKSNVASLSSTKEKMIISLKATTFSCRRGIIIKPGTDFEITTEFDYEILIFGSNNDFSLIYNWISKPEEYKKINISLSYSTTDFNNFNIFKIVESLRLFDIGNIYYFEEDSTSNIVQYMDYSLMNTDVFILFCSERAMKSESVKLEWQGAYSLIKKRKLKIIPIYKEMEYIPALLKSLISIKYDEDQFEKFIENLHQQIIRP